VNTANILVKCTNDNCTTDDNHHGTPAIYAGAWGHVEVLRTLQEGGTNVEYANVVRSTALLRTAFYGHLEVCRQLLDWGGKVDPEDKWKDTLLHDAARWGYL
jgi:ankyrin repeat protein